jgi:putative membrane-bound dehydrogenase-like protein
MRRLPLVLVVASAVGAGVWVVGAPAGTRAENKPPAASVRPQQPQQPAADPNAPMPAEESVKRIKMPPGFKATVLAAEPEVAKPIAFTHDDRGRVWVVQSACYPHWKLDGSTGTDKILIFEDTDGDGRFDKRTVFTEAGTNLSGIAIGFGGVWLCSLPKLIFIPLAADGSTAAGPAQVMLDGFNNKPVHNVFNSLRWGPDGWLYGCNGIKSDSLIGPPGTPNDRRVVLNAGVWRYHPVRKVVEAVTFGTTNPWGLDWNDAGEAFITNCVIKHLWHVIPGSRFQRMYGQDPNPHTYGLMESCADHIHWAGGNWTDSRGGLGAHDDAGGGHAHAGAMVYLGDNFPDEYRGRIFTANIHGNRINSDILEPHGSGYVGKHGPDLMRIADPWFRGLSLEYGPDGSVIISDWHDTGECHNYDKTHPSGRMYRISYGDPMPLPAFDVSAMSDDKLVKLQLHKNDWWVRRARRVLQERAAAGKLAAQTPAELRKILDTHADVTRRLRALWALHVVGALKEADLLALTRDPAAPLRVWAVRLAVEDKAGSDAVAARFAEMAASEADATVRLSLAGALQRLPVARRWAAAEALAACAGRPADAEDRDLPLMAWYAAEPLVPAEPARAAGLIAKARHAIVRQYLARRLCVLDDSAGPALAVKALAESKDDAVRRDILRGMQEAYEGRRQAPMPDGWDSARAALAGSADAEVRERSTLLSVLYGDKTALESLRTAAADAKAPVDSRKAALATLIQAKADGMPALLGSLLDDAAMRSAALKGLAGFNDKSVPERVLSRYAAFGDAERADAVATLATRPEWALALLDAVAAGKVAPRDISPFLARQMTGLKDKRVAERLTAVWGEIRPPAKDKAAQLAKYKSIAAPAALAKADRAAGRAVFARMCGQCHTLFDAGGKVGPDLTGSQRANPEYILTKVLDPNAVVSKEYQVTVFKTSDGRVINGIVRAENDKTLTVQTANEVLTLAKEDIEDRKKSPFSMMPEGQLQQLSDPEIRDLIAYLAGPTQVALPGKP